MTYANVGRLGVQPGRRDDVVAILTRHNPELAAAGCLSYEVGVSFEDPDAVFVSELWESQTAHHESLQLPSVQAAIAEAGPLLSGDMSGHAFNVAGSPLRAI